MSADLPIITMFLYLHKNFNLSIAFEKNPVSGRNRVSDLGVYAACCRYQLIVFFRPCLKSISAVNPKACLAFSVFKQRRG